MTPLAAGENSLGDVLDRQVGELIAPSAKGRELEYRKVHRDWLAYSPLRIQGLKGSKITKGDVGPAQLSP
jgi:hypothetical protein